MYSAFPPEVEPENWPHKVITEVAGNRYGKTVKLGILHLWFGSYKHRVSLPYASESWWKAKYGIINICPLNDLAYVVREKVGEILIDEAKEQLERPGKRGYVDKRLVALFMVNPEPRGKSPFLVHIPDTEYDGFRTLHNVVMEYRTTADHAKALQGRKRYLITFDEFTREKDPLGLIASDINPRTFDTRGIIFNTGTPHLETQSKSAEELFQLGWKDNPLRKRTFISFKRSIKENPALTSQMIEEALEGVPEYLVPQVTEGEFVQAEDAFFSADSLEAARFPIPNLRRRNKGHVYAIGWDLAVAKAGDRSIGTVIDVSTMPLRLIEFLELPKGTPHPAIISDWNIQLAWYANESANTKAMLVFDATGMGGLMFKTEASILYPRPRGFDFAGKSQKRLNILTTLKILYDKHMLVVPRECTGMFYEQKNYRRSDDHLETDAVFSLALAAYAAERMYQRATGKSLIKGSGFVPK